MTRKLLDTLDKNAVFKSSQINCIQDMLNTLTLNIEIEQTIWEYRFYDIIEHEQKITIHKNGANLSLDSTGYWLGQLMVDDSIDVPEDVVLEECKHYIFQIGNYEFNILAGGYVKAPEASRSYTSQELVKNLVK